MEGCFWSFMIFFSTITTKSSILHVTVALDPPYRFNQMEKPIPDTKFILPTLQHMMTWDDWKICVNLWQRFHDLSKICITIIRKEILPAGITKLVWEASFRCHTSVKLFISSIVTNSHLSEADLALLQHPRWRALW